MKDFVKGIYKKSIFQSDKGYIIGLLRVYETNIIEMQEYVKTDRSFLPGRWSFDDENRS